jgi:hypothetical protein
MLVLFWLLIVPLLVLFLGEKLLKKEYRIWKSVVSITVFYSFMVFMIYDHYKTDYFALMMGSFVWNVLIMVVIMVVDVDDKRSGKKAGSM